MFPTLDLDNIEKEINEEENEKTKKDFGKTLIINFDDIEEIVKIENGKPVMAITVKDKVKMYCKLLLRTELGKYRVNKNTGFGITYFNYRGKQLPDGFLNSELKREVEEKLKILNVVDRIEDFNAELFNYTLHVEFIIILNDSSTVYIQEVLS